jgi:hypothetical protein
MCRRVCEINVCKQSGLIAILQDLHRTRVQLIESCFVYLATYGETGTYNNSTNICYTATYQSEYSLA